MPKSKKQPPLQVRPPPAPAVLDAFVRGDEQSAASVQQPAASVQQPAAGVQQPAASVQQPAASVQQPAASVQQPATDGLPPVRGVRTGPRGARAPLTVYLPPEEVRRLKDYCYRNGLNMSDVAAGPVRALVATLPTT